MQAGARRAGSPGRCDVQGFRVALLSPLILIYLNICMQKDFTPKPKCSGPSRRKLQFPPRFLFQGAQKQTVRVPEVAKAARQLPHLELKSQPRRKRGGVTWCPCGSNGQV